MCKVKFDNESEIDALGHLYHFNEKYLSHEICDQGILCRVFTINFEGHMKKWFDAFTTGSIHSWEQFMQLFVCVHHNYNYDQSCEEIESIQREEDDSVVDIELRLIQHSYRFHDDDRPLERDYALFIISLTCKHFMKLNDNYSLEGLIQLSHKILIEDHKLEPHEFFGKHYKENTFLRRFLQNLPIKFISFLFIVEVYSGGRQLEVFAEVFEWSASKLENALVCY